MKFGPLPLDEAVGHILGHNVAGRDGRRLLRKGGRLTTDDVALLRAAGRRTVYVAQLEAEDVDENAAAHQIATAAAGEHVRLSPAVTGRCNFYATERGLVRVEVARLEALNLQPGVTLATLPNHSAVPAGKMIATLKILPYALPATVAAAAAALAATPTPLLWLQPLVARRVGLILSGAPSTEKRIRQSFGAALGERLTRLGGAVATVDFVPLEDESGEAALANKLQERLAAGLALIILAGETAIQDRYDIAPRAIERAGGEVVCFGAPVDPGNLLLLAYQGDTPILGAPGCARSPKHNIVDIVLPRLLAGDRLTQQDIVALAHGGLLEDVPERPLPRSRIV